jgi:phage baseplate assembly protein W
MSSFQTPSQFLKEVIGKGFKFPLTFSEITGGVTAVSGADGLEIINSEIYMVLTTRKGQYFRNPLFGSNLPKLLFEPVTPVLFDRIRLEVAVSIQKWVPQIVLRSTDSRMHDTDSNLVLVHGSYIISKTSVPGSFVFPFRLGSGPLS